jgi:surface antigen
MKKIQAFTLLLLLVLFGTHQSFAQDITFPMSYTSGSSLAQPPVDFTFYGNNYTLNNLLVTKNESNDWYTVYYFNLTYWWPKAKCTYAGCPGTGQVDIDQWLYAYDFGSNPVVFDYPWIIFDAPRSFFLSEVVYATFPIYDSNGIDVIREADIPTRNLNINRSPELGGGVVITHPNTFEYQCGTEGQEECEFDDLPYNSQVTLEESHNEGYAFSHWEINNQTMGDVDGTIVVPMNENKNVVTVFKKTFTCTNGSFQSTSGTGGWCVDYVNSETGVNLSGNASEWWQGAIDAGHATGSDPVISAIVVLDDSSLTYGHVGIVTDFNETTIWVQDSNWSYPYDFQIRNHTLSRSRSDISGYIYCTPQN